MTLRRPLLGLLALLACPAVLHSQASRADVRKVEIRLALDGAGMARLWVPAGAVRVSAWDRDSMVVTGIVPAASDFHCGGTRQAVKCATDFFPRDQGSAVPAQLEVRLPRRVRLWVKTESADIRVTGFGGDLDAYSVSGAIQVEGHARVITAESMGGEVRITADAVAVRAKSAGGRVVLSGRVSDATVTNVSGDISLLGGVFQRGRFESIDGAILWDGEIVPGAQLEFHSHSGPVRLRVPRGSAGEFLVTTYQGTLHNELGALQPQQRGARSGEPVRFTLGAANSARVTIQSFKGRVELLRK